ncbi:MAG: (Fe-S)-binding protein [Deinococcus sp.]|uniref:(Fe-S)-binding protein n=1 Tax=Deinococcus sp. TaxID=47478 RepID=UPI0026DD3756|nr:(Fe-S)-binding protein [Deinococcus sp.]MDO4247081.1 (Fe-S)-binding protein [Deinococcus sp.]
MQIDLFLTCVNDALFPGTGQATVRLLERLGHTVNFNPCQTCCGQMHLNSGYRDDALALARKFVRDFADSEVVVTPSGSCAAMVRELYPEAARWAGDEQLLGDVEKLAPRVFELSEFLVNKLGVTDVGAYYPHRVTYHPTCHAMRSLRVGDAPLKLLQNVRGMTLLELEGANECCGFGGTFAVKNPDVSAAMLTDKARHIIDTGAEACTAGDNSCLLHIGGGLHRLRSGTRTVHLAEILASTEQEVLA